MEAATSSETSGVSTNNTLFTDLWERPKFYTSEF